ncbi:dihydroorotase family protein [Chloroflexota bacterium]
MDKDYIIKNGKLVIPKHGILEADIAVKGEKIVQIGSGIMGEGKVIDASGKYIFPGCIDIHTHYGHYNEFYNEMESESKCLAFLGVTTSVVLLDRCIKNMEGWKERTNDPNLFANIPEMQHPIWIASYEKILPEVIEKSEKSSTNDFAFHLLMANTDQIRNIPEYHKEYGIASYKFWTGLSRTRPPDLTIPEILFLFTKCNEAGVLPYVNTLNLTVRDLMSREIEGPAKRNSHLSGPALVKESYPAIVETLDLHTVLSLAKEVGVPELLICHVASQDAAKLIRHYRREHGLNVQGEAECAWLSLWWPEIGEKLGYTATGIFPQLGYIEDVDSLWDGIRTGDITCIGTDGVLSPRKKYSDGKSNPFYQLPPTKSRPGLGFPCHTCMFPVVLHIGMERGFSPVQIAEICAYNPAKLMQLYPRKGTIAVGSDADLVIMDLGNRHVVKKDELISAAPFCPWEHWELNCWPALTMLRGQIIFENGKLIKEKTGKYQPRYP